MIATAIAGFHASGLNPMRTKSLERPNEKACITMRPGLHDEVKRLCKIHSIKQEAAFTSGMDNWVAGMNGAGMYKPIHQPDHHALERILNDGRPEAIEAIRAVMTAFLAAM